MEFHAGVVMITLLGLAQGWLARVPATFARGQGLTGTLDSSALCGRLPRRIG